ncbi:MAG: hypothetical protein PHE43_00450 [Candidatus Nanoarchaeia archaeon]|nr:hypothetical protein [Candidatus Nanoarchaeia archaeon]
MKISKDMPLSEITLRRYEKPSELQGRELVRKFCLSLGLLQPGDSRDIVVDILSVLLIAKKEQQFISSAEIQEKAMEYRKNHNLEMKGIAPSNIRRQLKKLKDMFLIESVNNMYRVPEFEDLEVIYNKKIEKFYLENIQERVREYFKAMKEF